LSWSNLEIDENETNLNFNFQSFLLSFGDTQSDFTVPLQSVADDSKRLFNARPKSTTSSYSEGRTFWVASTDQPRCDLERLALEIFKFHTSSLSSASFNPKNSGAEWWTVVCNEEDDIGFHWDKDYSLEEEEVFTFLFS